ncbi:hypothetical protein D3C75_1126080 [compost metagenome]
MASLIERVFFILVRLSVCDNLPKGRLRLAFRIEEKRPVFSSPYGEIIQPGIIVRHSPEGNGGDRGAVFLEQPEDFFKPFFLELLHLWRGG